VSNFSSDILEVKSALKSTLTGGVKNFFQLTGLIDMKEFFFLLSSYFPFFPIGGFVSLFLIYGRLATLVSLALPTMVAIGTIFGRSANLNAFYPLFSH
jgi:hypothetical protein